MRVPQVCVRPCFSGILRSRQKTQLGISAVSLRYLIFHSVCFSSKPRWFGSLVTVRSGQEDRGGVELLLTGAVMMLRVGSGKNVGSGDVKGMEGNGGHCLG